MLTGWRLIKRYVLFLIALIVLFPSLPYAAAPNNYCQIPPFVVGRVKPNLLLMIDNSASQYDLAYIAGSTTATTTFNCGGGVTAQTSFCYDNTYSNTYAYVGYFDPATIYWYNSYPATDSTGATFPFLPSSDIFTVVSSMPGSCNYGGSSSATPYVCINKTGSNATGFYATGNYLNWLSASKFDQQKQALTGGKYDTTNSLLGGESRGCVGGRFIKADPNLSGIIFAVRGPIEPDVITNTNTRGGMTRIEIYLGSISSNTMQSCQCAIAEWTSGTSYGQAQTDTKACLSLANNEINAFNQILQDCWKIKQNIAGGATFCGTGNGEIFKGVSINSDEIQCGNVYNDVCGSNGNLNGSNQCTSSSTAPGNWIANQGLTISSTGGAWQCTNQAAHLPPTSPYNACDSGTAEDPTDTQGFLGRCADFEVSHGKLSVNWDDNCVYKEILHYCFGTQVAAVIDPSEGAAVSSTTGNIPSVLMNSLVNQFGPPAGTFFVQVKTSSSPTGVIQDFASSIRFGAMKFNVSGSASECNHTGTNIECPTSGSNLDGGLVISYIQSNCSVTTSTSCYADSDCPTNETCVSSVGDHATSGTLINTIDSVVAETWTPFTEAFYDAIGYYSQRTDLRLNSGDFLVPPTQPSPVSSSYPCQQNNILFVTDGMSTADLNSSVNSLAQTYNDGDGQYDTTIPATCSDGTTIPFGGSRNLDDLAWLAQNKNITSFTAPISNNSQTIATHVIFTGSSSSLTGECNPATLLQETATNGGGLYQVVSTPSNLQTSLKNVFQFISNKASSGTAASVLVPNQGQGENLVEAMYYPKTFSSASGGVFSKEIQWVGRLQNLWYYADPLNFSNNAIYDDYSGGSPDKHLNTSSSDRTVQTCFIASPATVTINAQPYTNVSIACLNSSSCSSSCSTPVLLENIVTLWEAGYSLWNTSPSSRTIYTTTDGSTLSGFTTSNASTLQQYLQAASSNEAQAIIMYVQGTDNPTVSGTTYTYRPRTVDIKVNGSFSGTPQVWKLGDIINSTPKMASWVQLKQYDAKDNDSSYTNFINSSAYTGRGMVFVGGNDGMLHAFNLGNLGLPNSSHTAGCSFGPNDTACLSGSNLGSEIWAFIPKNALPYLRYMADPSYCHVYTVDLAPYLFDASIVGGAGVTRPGDGSSWRTILIGGMRTGGACRNAGTACNGGTTDCVNTPISDVGYSSYFALDVTNPNSPTLLWEFSNPALGYATSGPEIVRVGDSLKNGNWFVVLGSGPTGPIDTTNNQFLAHSDQNLKLFVIPLSATPGLPSYTTIDTGISNAFAGSMINSTVDTDSSLNYQDNVVYIPYVKKAGDGTWTDGGVGRLLTMDMNATPSPVETATVGSWTFSKVIDGIGPVTSAVAPLQNTSQGKLWLYFGTGRFFYEQGSTVDDASGLRQIFGVKDPCFSSAGFAQSCPSALGSGSLTSSDTALTSEPTNGWYIDLAASGSPTGLYAERVITDPLASVGGNVLFTTFQPYTNVCSNGGKTYLWAVDYKTGGAASALKGVVLIQTSTGSIQQLDLSSSSAFPNAGGRKSAAIEGVPPTGQGMSLLTSPPPVKRTIHMRER